MTEYDNGDSNLYGFLANFLPELEFCLSTMPTALAKLDELRQFYESRGRQVTSYKNADLHTAVLPMTGTDWLTEVKGCILLTDRVICDDPLLFVADLYADKVAAEEERFAYYNIHEAYLEWLRRELRTVWDVLPLVEAGTVIFQLIRRQPAGVIREIEGAVRAYLRDYMEVTPLSDPGHWPEFVQVEIPLLGFRGSADINRSLLGRDVFARDQAIMQYLPQIATHSLSTIAGLQVADTISGTFWTSSDWTWKLSRDAVGSLSPRTRMHSFIHNLERPILERASVPDLMLVRANDEALHAFRRELRIAEGLITCDPDEPGFDGQIRRVFEEVFKPSVQQIERSMKQNRILSQLPWFAASTGFAFAATTIIPSGPVLPGIFASLSAAAGFRGLYGALFDSEAPIRREPAFVLWKTAQLASESVPARDQ